jgi:hypothetical protein
MRIYVLFYILLLVSCTKDIEVITPVTPSNVVKVDSSSSYIIKEYLFDVTIQQYPNLYNGFRDLTTGFSSGLDGSISGSMMYEVNGTQHIIITPNSRVPVPPIHMINKGSKWEYEGSYPEGSMDGARNYSILDDKGTIAYANSGTEAVSPWPLGDIFTVKTIGDKLEWKKVSQHKMFYHSVGGGYLDDDNTLDLVAIHMGGDVASWKGDDGIVTFLNGVESVDKKFLPTSDELNKGIWPGVHHSGSILVSDIDGDGKSEIIRGDYGYNKDYENDRYSFAIYKYDPQNKKYKFYKTPSDLGIFDVNKYDNQGSTSIKSVLFNNDSFVDLIIASEGINTCGIQVWYNDGKGNFTPGDYKIFKNTDLQFREFEVGDINKDGKMDIFLHPLSYGTPSPPVVDLKRFILLNDNGKFKTYDKDLILPINPHVLKGFFIGGKLKLMGLRGLGDDGKNESFQLFDIELKVN